MALWSQEGWGCPCFKASPEESVVWLDQKHPQAPGKCTQQEHDPGGAGHGKV